MTPHDLIKHFGSQVAAQRALGLKHRQQIAKWVERNAIPLRAQIEIELATEHKLRADLPAAIRRRAA